MTQPSEKRQALRDIIVEFHKRAFGEEMARVNFLPVEERKKYLARVRARAAAAKRKPPDDDEAGFLTG